jgi:hypothetical protein
MSKMSVVAAVAMLSSVGACARHVEVTPQPPLTTAGPNTPQRTAGLNGRTFKAVLQPQNNSNVTGAASMTPGQIMGQTVVTLDLAGANAGTYSWHIHQGTCDNRQGVLGDESAYPQVTVGNDGKGRAQATIAVPPPSGGNYVVVVHSGSDENSALACGNLLVVGA